jgi:hypothetical protein
MPICKLVYLTVFCAKMSAFSGFIVEIVLMFVLYEPLSAFSVVFWEKEGQSSECLLNETWWEDGAMKSLAELLRIIFKLV